MAYSSNLLNTTIASSTSTLFAKSVELPNEEDEEIIVIDSGLREINVPETLKVVGVAGDQNCECLFFQIPRYFDGNDLSLHETKICYINAGKEYGEYIVTDIAVDEDFIVFGWQIKNTVTRYSGSVNFTVEFESGLGQEYRWQTVPAQLTVLSGLNKESTITDKDDVLFTTLSARVEKLEEIITTLQYYISIIENNKEKIEALDDEVQYLKENVVYTLSEV